MLNIALPSRNITLLSVLLRLLSAALVGGLIGMERGRHGRAAGMRTHILVCLGAALTALVGLYTVNSLGYDADPLRVGAQVISGIGFLGAGTILVKDRFQVTGLTTAAGLWATAAVGLALGVGFYEAAFLTAIFVLIVNELLPRAERHIKEQGRNGHIYVEVNDLNHVNDLTDLVTEKFRAENLQVTPPRSGIPGNLGLEIELYPEQGENLQIVCRHLSEYEYIAFAVDVL